MKRATLPFVVVLSLICGVAVAQAHGGPGGWGEGPGDHSTTPTVALAGTVVSVDPIAGTFVANVYQPSAHGWGDQSGDGHAWGHRRGRLMRRDWSSASTAPATTQVTISTNGSTVFRVNGQPSSISGLSAGQRFVALFAGSPTDSLSTITSGPALAVSAHSTPAARQLYAFVGKVMAVDTTSSPQTVTVAVTNSFPSSLVPAGSAPVTFTVSPDTLVLGGSSSGNGLEGGSLSNVAVGDIVAGGEIATAGETLSQVSASPLGLLVDFPASSSSSSSSSSSQTSAASQSAALHEALGLFGYHSTGTLKHKSSRGKKHHAAKHHHKQAPRSHSSVHAQK